MTIEQLEVLGKLMRSDKKSIAFLAAKMVLVEGQKQIDVANSLGAKTNTINNGVQRYKEAHREVEKAYLVNKTL